MSDQKKYKELPEDVESFSQLINQNKFFVDKTPYIKTVLKHSGAVQIFTRPRRFGKTLFINMLADFFRINKDNPLDKEKTKALFKGTAILEDKEFTDKYLGNFPVINISLKSVFGNSYIEAYKKLAELISEKALEFDYLNESDKLLYEEKRIFQKLQDKLFLSEIENNDYLTSSIESICNFLYQHYKKQVVVIIDDYDIPLTKAAENGYHDDMVFLMCAFLNFLKAEPRSDDGSIPIYKIIMTGCLNVAKSWNDAGVNNYSVNTLLDNEFIFSSMIGLTKDEVIKMLEDYGMSEYIDMVKDNYGGYKLYKDELFCPFDVVNFVADNYRKTLNSKETVKADNYWSNLTSNSAVYEYIDYLTDKDTQNMQNLVDGKSISFKRNDSIYYDCLSYHNSDDYWSLLLHTGYLTKEWDKTNTNKIIDNSSDNKVSARIPNLEILRCFTDNIKDRFNNKIAPSSVAEELANRLFEGDADSASDTIFNLLQNYVSISDSATKALHENYYRLVSR